MQRLALALVALGLGVSVGGVARAAAAAPASSPLDKLAWLGGCWESATDRRVTVEMWLPPAGGLMVGASRTVAGGEARSFEHLRLRADGDTLVYTAIPSDQQETDFRSTAVHEHGFTVENLAHDFPQRIVYTRTGADTVNARVEGPGRDGATRGFDLAYRRVACEVATGGR
ncbi:MAG: hypothetical protein KJ061_02885 [Vicinamibacteraceae bacterium]|nr:hypothetical protein [Vicinamibacteraceae bacterium]MCL4846232.1 hypothetical protein [Acidobacteriota bacterium]